MLDLERAGTEVGTIDVTLSYRIIELFSAGLYSSPNKAFEELVCNSYDAFADAVAVYVPPDLTVDSAHIWVCDNGEGMDVQGLQDLWRIGVSKKRTADREGRRLQIGRFGIGKLATYVLANKLTYVSKCAGQIRAVTMDYGRIEEGEEELTLTARQLSPEMAEALLEPYVSGPGRDLPFRLFGEEAPPTWTFSILSSLKPKAHEIREGRLKWVLRTALPLSPAFNLYYNGATLTSSKFDRPLMKRWTIGKNDTIAEADPGAACRQDGNEYVVDFENLKGVHGKIELYEDSLVQGKAGTVGRSHGIFLMVRGRLINLDDPTLGMEAFSHGAFNRTRIVVHADGLDDHLTSTRESVRESRPLHQLRDYIKRKFNNETRKYYFDKETERAQERDIATRLSRTSLTASKRPLLVFAERYFEGAITNPLLIQKPSLEMKDNLLTELRRELSEEEPFIQIVNWEILHPGAPIAQLCLESRTITINLLHPFIANYIDEYKSTLPLEFVAISEVLTEAHLYELGLEESETNGIMRRRDNTFRELSLSDREGAPAVAQMVKDAVAAPQELEDGVYCAMLALGFEATQLGGKGEPDGVASAVLGYSAQDVDEGYALIYEAKSTKWDKIQAAKANLAVVKKHQREYRAGFAVVVAVDFEGGCNDDSSIAKMCRQQSITCMRARDLIRLLLLSAPKQIGLRRIRELLETCHSPGEVKAWIDSVQGDHVGREPIEELLETIYELQKTDTEPPEIASVRIKLNERIGEGGGLSKEKILGILESLKTFIPGFITIEGEKVGVQGTPQKIVSVIASQINSNVPSELQEMYLTAFAGE